MNFKINLSNGSVKELIEILQEIDKWKYAHHTSERLFVSDARFKKKYLVKFCKGAATRVAGTLPYSETTIEFEEIEETKENDEDEYLKSE